MAEQARKFGARIAELRKQRDWKQRDLVAAMAELGDQSLNTNQLSRYENGGAMPGEIRAGRFADALETTVADLHDGPMAERRKPKAGDLSQLDGGARQLDRIEQKLDVLLAATETTQAADDAIREVDRRAEPSAQRQRGRRAAES